MGPKFKTGHGQSFGYNPKDKHLYNAVYTLKSDKIKNKHPFKFQKISRKSLKPTKVWTLNLRYPRIIVYAHYKAYNFLQMHDLTFDKKGNFYFSRMYGKNKKIKNRMSKYSKRKGFKPKNKKYYTKYNKYYGRSVDVYQGHLTKHSARVKLVARVSNAIGTVGQGLTYRASLNRLFFTYDNAFMSIPIKKLGHKIKVKDLNFTVLKAENHRESEGMGITSKGYGYLILNRFAEASRSTTKVK